jgi:hypothetical protein
MRADAAAATAEETCKKARRVNVMIVPLLRMFGLCDIT